MARKVGAIDFSNECRRLLKEFGSEAHVAINELTEEAADIAVKMIRGNVRHHGAGYAKGWAKKRTSAWGFGTTYSVYNKTHYRVAHLLDKDHPFRNKDGRTIAQWKGDHAVADAEEYTFAWLDNAVRKKFG